MDEEKKKFLQPKYIDFWRACKQEW